MALQKFLFVGIGGSGGLTISALRHVLQLQLEAKDWGGGIPGAWKFINIDVAASQGGETDGIRLLPEREYLGLTRPLLRHREENPYRHLDEAVSQYGRVVSDYVSGWRPDRASVKVDPVKGAGQYRAIGRMVIGATMTAAHERLATAFRELKSPATNIELAKVSQKLTGVNRVSSEPVQPIVITSLAGGSGSGQVSDVCDLIRKIDPGAARQLVAILYAPDVFSDLDEGERDSVNPNALATLAELLNGHWNAERPDPREFALLNAGGGAVSDDVCLRGPRLMYVVGRANESIVFNKQYDVYRAVGRALAAWTTSAELQARISQYELGNVTTQAQRRDTSGLKEDLDENPLGSLGFACVGIGLDRFARYSAQRLARSSVEHLLRGHWPPERQRDTTEEAARKGRANEVVDEFLKGCELREHHDTGWRQITDAVRGMPSEKSKERVEARVLNRLVDRVTEGTTRNGLPSGEVRRRIIERTKETLDADVAAMTKEYVPNAMRWAERIQARVAQAVGHLIAEQGAPVAYEVLDIAITRLRSGTDLDARSSDAWEQELDERASRELLTAGPFRPGNPLIHRAAGAAVDTVHTRCEDVLAKLCGPLVEDFAANLLAPLRDALGGARDVLQADLDGTPERPSLVKGWPVEAVTAVFEPARNELLLEPIIGYPDLFKSLITAVVEDGDTAFQNALAQARGEVISGVRERQDLTPLVVESSGLWRPRDGRLRRDPAASSARFAVHTRADQLLARAHRWIKRPDSRFGVYLRQNLADYLNPEGVGEQIGIQRRSAFERMLDDARRASSPFVELDSTAYTRVHEGFSDVRSMPTPFPFPPNHPARAIVTDAFAGYDQDRLGGLFGDDPTGGMERIDIFTFLDAPVQPMVMYSLSGPIKDQWASDSNGPDEGSKFWTWRRTRPLPWFIPCSPGVRRAMVRGWFVARFLGYIPDVDPNQQPFHIFCASGEIAEFPHPLLSRPGTKREEWMPAVLESLALGLIGKDLTPYRRLRSLGNEVLGQAGELLTWINEGHVPAGAESPDKEVAGLTSDEPGTRREALTATISSFLKNFENLPRTRLTANGEKQLLAWELRTDILLALAAIQACVDRSADVAEFEGLG